MKNPDSKRSHANASVVATDAHAIRWNLLSKPLQEFDSCGRVVMKHFFPSGLHAHGSEINLSLVAHAYNESPMVSADEEVVLEPVLVEKEPTGFLSKSG
jgi:hypothetical protein